MKIFAYITTTFVIISLALSLALFGQYNQKCELVSQLNKQMAEQEQMFSEQLASANATVEQEHLFANKCSIELDKCLQTLSFYQPTGRTSVRSAQVTALAEPLVYLIDECGDEWIATSVQLWQDEQVIIVIDDNNTKDDVTDDKIVGLWKMAKP